MSAAEQAAVERLAALISKRQRDSDVIWGEDRRLAQNIIDAGWHDEPTLTDADRAVLDAAEAVTIAYDTLNSVNVMTGMSRDEWLHTHYEAAAQMRLAVRARREART